MPTRDAARCVVFDVGGTSLRAALYSPLDRRLYNTLRVPTPSRLESAGDGTWSDLCATMRLLERRLMDGHDAAIVSVALPGPISPAGALLAAPTVCGRPGSVIDARNELTAMWPRSKVVVVNDITAAGYRYVERGYRDFCIITISSGIGHKVFAAGQPLTGPGGRGGEIGHLRVDYSADALVCDCGLRGHLGAVSSGRGTVRLAQRIAGMNPDAFARSRLASDVHSDAGAVDAVRLADAFRDGDEFAVDVVSAAATYIGHALAAIHTATGTERFVIIGGFAFALGERYRTLLAAAAAASCWDLGVEWNSIVEFGVEDDDAGMLGAGFCATGLTERR